MPGRAEWLVVLTAVWAFVVMAALTLLDALRFDYVYVLSLIGFLFIFVQMSPLNARPQWKGKANLIMIAGVAGFIIVAMKNTGII